MLHIYMIYHNTLLIEIKLMFSGQDLRDQSGARDTRQKESREAARSSDTGAEAKACRARPQSTPRTRTNASLAARITNDSVGTPQSKDQSCQRHPPRQETEDQSA